MEFGRVLRGDVRGAALAAVGLLVLAAGPTTFHATPASVPAYVDPILRSSLAAGPQPAILVVEPGSLSALETGLARLGLEHRLLGALGAASVLLDAATLDAVAALPGVVTVYRNERMHPLLDRSADYVGATTVWDTYDVTGRGVTVLVMDSGIDGNHPDLPYGKKVLANVVPTRQGSGLVGGSKEGVVSSDVDGHGTHVAGIVAASGAAASGKYRGIAPGASLVGFQAGLPDAKTGEIEFDSLTVLEGFNWAIANRDKYDLSIVSNSWGANGEFDPRSPVNIATLNLYKAGLLVLFAAGNEGDDGGHTLNKYSVAPWVLSVTAGDYLNQVPRFASRGTDAIESRAAYDHPDLVAPGVGITSTRSLRSHMAASGSPLYATKSGSSMATPHVAGVAALLLEANPRLSPDDLMDILTATATPMRSPMWEAGAGYVNVLKAHQLAAKATGHRDAFLSGKVKYAGPASGDLDYSDDAVTVGYMRGQASRLRSPDTSLPAFVKSLFLTMQGQLFLVGGLVLGLLAFGRNVPPAPQRSLNVPTPPATPSRTAHASEPSPRPLPRAPVAPALVAPSGRLPGRHASGVQSSTASSLPRLEAPRR